MRYHHVGIPTDRIPEGAEYLPDYKLYCTDHLATPYGIQWMKYEADCPLPSLVKQLPHVAFEVDDLQAALQGKKVIIEPNEPSPGVKVAFIEEAGAPVELMEYTNSHRSDS